MPFTHDYAPVQSQDSHLSRYNTTTAWQTRALPSVSTKLRSHLDNPHGQAETEKPSPALQKYKHTTALLDTFLILTKP